MSKVRDIQLYYMRCTIDIAPFFLHVCQAYICLVFLCHKHFIAMIQTPGKKIEGLGVFYAVLLLQLAGFVPPGYHSETAASLCNLCIM